MQPSELQQYTKQCREKLDNKQSLLKKSGFDTFDPYTYNSDFQKEEISILKNGITTSTANIIPIGCFNHDTNSWMWLWGKHLFPQNLREKSLKLQELDNITGMDIFKEEFPKIEEGEILDIIALCVDHLNSEGILLWPMNNTSSATYYYSLSNIATSEL